MNIDYDLLRFIIIICSLHLQQFLSLLFFIVHSSSCFREKSMGAVSAFMMGNYPHQPAVASVCEV